MKMVLLPDHIPVNNFDLLVVGGPPVLQFITLDGFEWELDTVDLPDRTKASGGSTKAIEFSGTHPKHHAVEDAFLQLWFVEAGAGSDVVLPTYKKAATLVIQSISRLQTRSFNLVGMFPMKQKTADRDIGNEGEMDVTEWTFSADLPIPL
jgi:hypothetical protein